MDVNGLPPLSGHHEEESPDALDITPRTGAHTAASPSTSRRRLLAVGVVVVLVGALGLVLFNGLNDAALFYRNVDEALAQRSELADSRFRMQGNVVEGTVEETSDGITFMLSFGGAQTRVVHHGSPPELFAPDIPVILEGRFGKDAFESDEILIRHDSTYTEEHKDRLDEADRDVEQRTRSAG